MSKKVLITGGAGFIGSHLVDKLVNEKDYDVTVLDLLEEQVHGNTDKPPEYLNKKAKFLKGSVTNYGKLEELVGENDIIFHMAAMVGVGQSMYQIKKYVDNNILGVANLLDILVNKDHSVEKMVIASSNTVYGEGRSRCGNCGIFYPNLRSQQQLEMKNWEITCPSCGQKSESILTDEKSPFNSSSIYALSKQVQEEMALMVGSTYGINTTILRFFLVYGSRQALSNPYTGVCSIFISRLLQGKSPIIFEDGNQSRDFVNVYDVCKALLLSINKKEADGEIFNVGSGIPITINEVAERIIEKINPNLKPNYNQQYRVGDIRHCIADISKIKNKLGYEPTVTFKNGIDELMKWIKTQKDCIQKHSHNAIEELREKDLLK